MTDIDYDAMAEELLLKAVFEDKVSFIPIVATLLKERDAAQKELHRIRTYCTFTFGTSHPEIVKCGYEVKVEELTAERDELKKQVEGMELIHNEYAIVEMPGIRIVEKYLDSLNMLNDKERDVIPDVIKIMFQPVLQDKDGE